MEEVKAYYAGFAEREWARLDNPADGQLEFAVTCDVLARHLPVGARVLDLGGGPGRYAIWLAEHEYRVTLADADERRHLLDAGFLERVLGDGVFVNDVPGRFTQGYGVRLGEVEPFFARFGFEQLALLSAESVTVGLESELPALLGDPELA